MAHRTVRFYVTADGRCPVRDFLDALPGKAAQKVTWVLKLLEDLDAVPASYFKKLVNTDEIWECRIQFGSSAYRLFCFFADSSIVVLTHGISKKTQKTPGKEIARAEACRREYFAGR